MLISLISIFSCGRTENQTSSGKVETILDSPSKELAVIDSPNKELSVYSFKARYKRNGSEFGLVSLSESYAMDSNSSAIPGEYLNYNKALKANSIKLTDSYRKRFLEGTHISETDKVFIYHYASNALITLNVMDIDVVAMLDGYIGYNSPINDDDFYYGFEINLKDLEGFSTDISNTFIYVGKENPFTMGDLKPIKWETIDSTAYPVIISAERDSTFKSKSLQRINYKYVQDNISFWVQDLRIDSLIEHRRLVITESNSGEIIKDLDLSDEQHLSYEVLNLTDLNPWTGKLFKNKPAVAFGFSSVNFGCESIFVLEKNASDVIILCDNRH